MQFYALYEDDIVVPPLLKLLEGSSEDVRIKAAMSLGKIGRWASSKYGKEIAQALARSFFMKGFDNSILEDALSIPFFLFFESFQYTSDFPPMQILLGRADI
ncbi:MAG: HEAT repeat domain-containing protein [Planctomycetota bacterium]|nr:MAG: HEAT repeat domain-containing protein [Planctomycetota bacterium]